ncbi:MarR family winged helix-turn-helix transcriptional regulator [Mycobacterium sp. E1747]|uniref:MarR family winged helix-turn-helix transcriptional regulator n=1 Tax=Mycobacterium sp. E1747 TaxID=1834128 RepID=UPI000800B3F0|nr:MarR family transcriptional regulator [Mycobacterium sp. E1747]OBH14006.1 MarR family transcriptional regulator [Mycobacterium sp. E1747]
MPRATEELDVDQLAGALYRGVALIVRRLKQLQAPEELTLPQRTALARLDRGGPSSAANLARAEQITPQAMSVTLGALEKRGLVQRRPDPHDGRQVVMSLTKSGRAVLHHYRDARARQFSKVLAEKFSPAELRLLARAAPLIERLGTEL